MVRVDKHIESVAHEFVKWLHDLSLSYAQSVWYHGQWYNEVSVIGPLGLSLPPASSDDSSSSQLLGFVQYVDRSSEGYNPHNPFKLLFFFSRIQKLVQKSFDLFHEA
ncbi:hypothetical protein TNCV_4380851 [Trichonephila clavipes]|nr:hypothetical protein TNCV_4380851 [Trichonephila clavipes]